MNQQGGARAVEKLMQQFGCLPSAPDGPIVSTFDPVVLANAVEQEVRRSKEYGWSKVTLHMDLPDAELLVRALRR